MISSHQEIAGSQNFDETGSVVPTFYVVSRKKLAILYIATFGIYAAYWFYRNWSNYKSRSDKLDDARRIWPILRGLFAIFFTHALFRKIKAYGQGNTVVAEWEDRLHATRLVTTMILSQLFDHMNSRSSFSPNFGILSLLFIPVLLPQFLNVQNMINISCGDPSGDSNSNLTIANYAWITLGVAIWILVVLGIYRFFFN